MGPSMVRLLGGGCCGGGGEGVAFGKPPARALEVAHDGVMHGPFRTPHKPRPTASRRTVTVSYDYGVYGDVARKGCKRPFLLVDRG